MKNRILIIDDDETFRENLAELLNLNGYQTETAVNGAEGLLKITDFMPDLVLCDIEMPVINGYQVLKQLRCQNVYNTVAFVSLSAHIPSSDDEMKLITSANDYIIKPIRFVSLLRNLEHILS